MAEYVRKDEAMALAYNIFKKGGSANNVYFALKKLKPANVRVVRHSHWIGGDIGKCSICGMEGCASDIWNGADNGCYCPNCGALMIEEE